MIQGPVTRARRALTSLPQMSEGGAHRMLLFAADHPVLPVDTNIRRVATRLGYGSGTSASARTIRRAIASELEHETEAFRRTFLYLSHHAAATCTEASPHCTICPLAEDCPYRKISD